jgi:hypothetical protein
MKVSSPVGDFPFKPERIEFKGGRLVVVGSMGAWPARVEIGLEDIAQLVRLSPPAVLATAGVLALGVIRLVAGSRRSGGAGS